MYELWDMRTIKNGNYIYKTQWYKRGTFKFKKDAIARMKRLKKNRRVDNYDYKIEKVIEAD